MPRVRGFLRVIRRGRPEGPVDPDWGIEEGVDPGYGVDEGLGGGIEHPEHPIELPPPGIWPPLTPEHPWRPLPGFPDRPSQGLPPSRPPAVPGQPLPPGVGGGPIVPPEEPEVQPPIVLPPGMIWPPLPPGVHGKYLALVLIAGAKGVRYHYTVIDANLRPGHGLPPYPDQGLPSVPEREPK